MSEQERADAERQLKDLLERHAAIVLIRLAGEQEAEQEAAETREEQELLQPAGECLPVVMVAM